MRRPYVEPDEFSLMRAYGLPGKGSAMRAADAERERAAEVLRQHHADGRLSTDELEERIARAYAATTLGDLDELFDDLPRLRLPGDRRRSRRARWVPPVFAIPFVTLFVALAVVTSGHALFFVWPLMFFLVLRFAFMRRAWWGPPGGWPGAYHR
jgi:hypothetical protein